MDKKEIRVLHIVSALDGGGVEKMLYNYYTNINQEKIKFDFIVHGSNKGRLEKRFEQMGSKIWHVTPKKNNFIKNIQEINFIIKTNYYKIVHVHQNFSSGFPLILAKINKVPIRIAHSHGCNIPKRKIIKIKNNILRWLILFSANHLFACENNSANWLYGKMWDKYENKKIIYNAIDLNEFQYLQEIRNEYREKLNLNNKLALLHVGRFSEEKNHKFLIEILEEVKKIQKQITLILVGNGELEKNIRADVKKKKLDEHVLFLGNRDDVSNLMSAADIFIFPSIHEGLPLTIIEAQASGIKILASDRVSNETEISKLINYLPLEIKADGWANEILKNKDYIRNSEKYKLLNDKYCIKNQAIKYEEWILEVVKNV